MNVHSVSHLDLFYRQTRPIPRQDYLDRTIRRLIDLSIADTDVLH